MEDRWRTLPGCDPVCCRLLQLQRCVLSPDSEVPDELLYGRAGYLYALLYVTKELGAAAVDQDTVSKVPAVIITECACEEVHV